MVHPQVTGLVVARSLHRAISLFPSWFFTRCRCRKGFRKDMTKALWAGERGLIFVQRFFSRVFSRLLLPCLSAPTAPQLHSSPTSLRLGLPLPPTATLFASRFGNSQPSLTYYGGRVSPMAARLHEYKNEANPWHFSLNIVCRRSKMG